jgi:ribose transport system permease protein
VNELSVSPGTGRTGLQAGAEFLRREIARPPVIAGVVVLLLLVIGKATTPQFVTGQNLIGVVRSASITGIVAIGVTFITISGRFFSLSVEQTGALAGIILAMSLNAGFGTALSLLVVLAAVVALGAIQGVAVARGANPIITTLGAGGVLVGASALLTGNQTKTFSSGALSWLGNGTLLAIPAQTWVFFAITAAAAILLTWTRAGRTITLTGTNQRTAVACGLSVRRATVLAFILAALAAGIAGVLVAVQSGQADVGQMSGTNLDAAAAVLIGGTAIQGGEGSVVRTAFGAAFVVLLQNFAIIRGYSYGVQVLFEGVAVTIAVSGFWLLRQRSR